MLAVALGVVLERHLEAASPAELALWSLRGLEVLEPGLKPELRAGTLLLSRADRLVASRPVPQPPPGTASDAAAVPLAVTLAALFDVAWRSSPALRRAGQDGMLRSAFEELFNHLDPYSRYVSPAEAVATRTRRVGQAGLGLRLAAGRGRRVVVAALLPEGPAAQAGLRPGDQVLAVDGIGVSVDDLAAAATLLEGPAGTAVTLRLQRGGRRFDALLHRIPGVPEPLQAERREDALWIRLDAFSALTETRLIGALRDGLRPPRPRGVVLDLRGNRGGLLGQAAAVASAFLPGGLVGQTAGRHPDAARRWEASGPDQAEGLPVVVLIDGRTASAAEIVAAALADRGRAVVVGSASTGKGLIQLVVPLPNGAELLVSWSRVLAPLGWPIQGLGVLPMVCTSLGTEATAGALVRLRQGEAPMALPLARLRAARAPVPGSEVAALRNTCPPAEGRPADLAVARTLLEQPETYAAALAQ
ncbi:peptidase S41 [Siccirubricoccus deserti]|uniref:PDZ domain-containing protein n=1 Tax=Siccirubricoccus deserti TaxID=2013562 RepID=A0A9X0QZ61_9PROT|nr:S41 family peptidase [Siccirubricoccus deserti]MBC4015362.1 PDZ domain-containing protein [Siccirubricoccus deserti]GGC41048.1 peptidase S41 [Siccirubricoccus deserti]